MGRSLTIKDVAQRAGVSVATVSRVINRRGPTSAEARAAVQRAVVESGFRPSAIGRALKTARSRTLGVLVPSLKNPIFADTVQGIERRAEAAGYGTLLASSHYAPDKELAAVEVFLANRVAGLVLTVADENASPALELLSREALPHVLVFNPARAPEHSGVTIDNRGAARQIVGRLIELGHRRIAMIAGNFESSDRSGLRRAGYEDALRSAGLAPGPVVEASFTARDLSGLCAALWAGDDPPTAIFCSTDLLAIAAIRALAGLGLRVPRDVSVAGFDGIDLGQWITPSLATVVQPAERMGEAAVEHLLQRVDSGAAALHLTLEHGLRPGESWGPPPVSAVTLSSKPDNHEGPVRAENREEPR